MYLQNKLRVEPLRHSMTSMASMMGPKSSASVIFLISSLQIERLKSQQTQGRKRHHDEKKSGREIGEEAKVFGLLQTEHGKLVGFQNPAQRGSLVIACLNLLLYIMSQVYVIYSTVVILLKTEHTHGETMPGNILSDALQPVLYNILT